MRAVLSHEGTDGGNFAVLDKTRSGAALCSAYQGATPGLCNLNAWPLQALLGCLETAAAL